MNGSHSHNWNARFVAREYVEACEQSAKRTRTVVVVLVVACVLVFIGFYNSLQSAWMLQRIRAAYDPNSQFIHKKLGSDGNANFLKEDWNGNTAVDDFRKEFQKSLTKAYVDNTYFIRAPFFGIAFDINDMGLIGGVSLIAVLVLLRFCLAREIRNLDFSFKQATQHEKLFHFYHALAMHQVFTVPSMHAIPTRRFLRIAPKLVYVFPVAVFLFGVLYDYYTVFVLKLFSFQDNRILLVLEAIFFFIIWWLCLSCRNRHRDIDNLWETYRPRAFGERSRVFLLEPSLVKLFDSDEAINQALKESIKTEPEASVQSGS